MKCLIVTGFTLTGLALFVMAGWLHAHLSPYYHVNAIPSEGLEDTYFKGEIKFHCPKISYEFRYSFVSPLTSVQLLAEGRNPVDLCRPSPMSIGEAPLCPNNAKGILKGHKVPLSVCEQIRDSSSRVKIIPGGSMGNLAIGSLKNHATD